MPQPVAILASGMVTAVGLSAPSSCAAIRCAITNFVETRFMDQGGEWIIGCPVPLAEPWRGRAKLVQLVAPAIRECLHQIAVRPQDIALLLCVAEATRPGRLEGLEDRLYREVETTLGMRFHRRSGTIPRGNVAGIVALQAARQLMAEEGIRHCLIAGADTFLVAATLSSYEEKRRLRTSKNSDGFIPGEAGAAVLVGLGNRHVDSSLDCLGMGFGQESATIDAGEPLRADGLVAAIRSALSEAGRTMGEMDYRITDLSGEQYGFKEASLALSRTLHQRKERFDIWHPADCIGEVGAAIVPCMLTVAASAHKKGYAPGRSALCHAANDMGERAAMALTDERQVA